MRAGQVAVEVGQPVDHGRVALKRDAPAQPIVEHAGDERPFRGRPGFLLHQRGQGQHLVPGPAQGVGALLHGRGVHLVKTVQHAAQNFFRAIRFGEEVRVRIDVAFHAAVLEFPPGQKPCVAAQRQKRRFQPEALRFQFVGDLLEGQPFGNGDRVPGDPPLRQDVQQGERAHRLGQLVLAALQAAVLSGQARPEPERPLVFQHAGIRQEPRGVRECAARPDEHARRFGQSRAGGDERTMKGKGGQPQQDRDEADREHQGFLHGGEP